MKIDISHRKLDSNKLIEKMNEYEIISNQSAYLFMNKETMDALIYSVDNDFTPNNSDSNDILFFHGRRVYKNDSLKFGEIEIR